MKIFTRADEATTRQTLAIFRKELFRDKKTTTTFLILIPISHFLRFVATPLLVSFIIQSLIKNPENYQTALWLMLATATTMIISTLCNDKGYTLLFNHEEQVQTRLLKDGLNNLMSRSYQFFTEQKVGTLAGDLMNYSRSYTALGDAYFLNTNHLLIGFACGLIVIGILTPILLVPTVGISAILIGLNVKNVRARAPYRNERKRLTSELAGSIADIMGNQLLVRIFATESYETGRVKQERIAVEKISRKEIEIIEHESLLRQAVLYTFQLFALLLFVWLGATGRASIAGIIFTFTYLNRSTDAIFGISAIMRQYEQAFLDAAPMVKILNMPVAVTDKPNAVDLRVKKGQIELRDVNFAYADNSDDSVFTNLHLFIPPGQRLGLAGHSGGGKTTLTKLLLRFTDIDSGEIEIDGQNIADARQTSLRSQIAYVPQDPFLFHRSLRENISYGRLDATEKEIISAAKKAHAWEFIVKLPRGLDTVVGERGVKLSGGQRQRIAIARAILKDAPILILDEATSALDSDSEKLIQKSLETLMTGRTSIVIAHRLSTIAKLDRIIVLEDGKIVEDGSHEELLVHGKIYATLWNHQAGGFINS